MIGIYVHIPFCVRKCRYCDFPSYGRIGRYMEPYVEAVCREINAFPGGSVDTVYFGGGTPSLLSAEGIGKIMHALERRFHICSGAEITVEANPDSMDGAYAKKLAAFGVNRVSLGIQSFDDAMLAFLGRIHTAQQARQAVQAVYDGGIGNVSVDLMYGLPGQTADMVAVDMKEIAQLPVCHASIYSLIVEEHTPLWDDVRKRRCLLPDDRVVENMRKIICKEMHAMGFGHYEISSYAKDGRMSKHNCKYWQYEPYIGFGASAHSFYQNERWANIANIPDYIRRAGKENIAAERIVIDRKRGAEDYCFLALRMQKGIDYGDFASHFSCSITDEFGTVLNSLFLQGLLEKTERGCRLTRKGLAYGNYVFSRFIRD